MGVSVRVWAASWFLVDVSYVSGDQHLDLYLLSNICIYISISNLFLKLWRGPWHIRGSIELTCSHAVTNCGDMWVKCPLSNMLPRLDVPFVFLVCSAFVQRVLVQ